MTPESVLPANMPLHLTSASLPSVARSAAGEQRRWADHSESTTTMTTKGRIVGRCGGLVIWEARV